MRHILEDELHAYLDQGLSRSQCVEIESHLAGCPSCRATRDGIAALRDRTTALLAKLAPPRRFPPALESIRERAAKRVTVRRRRLQVGAWAASLIAALGLGWTASTMLHPDRPSVLASRSAAPVAQISTAERAADTVRQVAPRRPVTAVPVRSKASTDSAPARANATPAGRRAERDVRLEAARLEDARLIREDSIRQAKLAVLDPAPVLELTPLNGPTRGAGEQFGGMWRTMSWDGAQSEAGQSLPHIDGLPVLGVQVQANEQGKRPLMVVAQQLASGRVIQTIEGPASDVSQLLSRRSASAADMSPAVAEPSDTEPVDQAMAMQVGDRMLAITGALPSDSLRAMIRRINAEMRTK